MELGIWLFLYVNTYCDVGSKLIEQNVQAFWSFIWLNQLDLQQVRQNSEFAGNLTIKLRLILISISLGKAHK